MSYLKLPDGFPHSQEMLVLVLSGVLRLSAPHMWSYIIQLPFTSLLTLSLPITHLSLPPKQQMSKTAAPALRCHHYQCNQWLFTTDRAVLRSRQRWTTPLRVRYTFLERHDSWPHTEHGPKTKMRLSICDRGNQALLVIYSAGNSLGFIEGTLIFPCGNILVSCPGKT